jgi:hypothetical protein
MVVKVEKYQLIWKQHVIGMQDSRLPKLTAYFYVFPKNGDTGRSLLKCMNIRAFTLGGEEDLTLNWFLYWKCRSCRKVTLMEF